MSTGERLASYAPEPGNINFTGFFLPQRANADERLAAIAMAHGVGAVKEMYIDFFARRGFASKVVFSICMATKRHQKHKKSSPYICAVCASLW